MARYALQESHDTSFGVPLDGPAKRGIFWGDFFLSFGFLVLAPKLAPNVGHENDDEWLILINTFHAVFPPKLMV